MSIVLIGDSRVKKIEVRECGDKVIDLMTDFPSLTFDLERRNVQKDSKSISHARRKIGEMLMSAQAYLPTGVKLLIKECHRPMAVQKMFWDTYSAYLKAKNPSWVEQQIYDECSKFNAPLDVAPHTTGGAVDLTLVDLDGQLLDMGTEFNASPYETAGATYTDADDLSLLAKSNRRVLVKAMFEAGFTNYPTEWWHWSYGDKYWALVTNQPFAIYDSVELE